MKKINKEKIFETAIQIFLLMIYIFAFSYIIDSISKEIKPVSADSGSQCCAKTNSGAICQNIPAQECESECSDSCQFTTCENSVECKPGCCITKEGNCAASSPKASCELGGGEWVDGSACNIGDCIKGCCVLGSETVFTTEKNCEFLTLSFGFEQQDFRGNMRTELECLALREVQKQGACVFEQDKINTCKFTSQQECVKLTGNSLNFYENFLCSHPGLNTNCEKQISTGCLETNDEVYWFDSCGNRENIYSSDKETSWNNGMVLKKEESCSPTLSNINSKDCGNCNYLLSSKCYKAEDVKPDVGEYICKDMSCVDNKGKKHSNGESWCVYDGAIGKGRDLVGSRHFKMSCINGEIKNEPCADYRNEICVQSNIQTERQVISSASCVINKWQMCIEGSGCKAGSRDCFAQSITLSKEIDTINSCLPNYPPGFDLTTREGEDYARKLCGIASYKCTAVLVDGECESNCECLLPEFSEKMHNWCTSLGDCGYKKNIIGESTKNEYLSGAPDARSPVGIVGQQEGNYAQPDSIQTLESLGIKQSYAKSSEGKTPKEEADLAWLKMAMGISGASGMVLMWVAPYLTTYTVGGTMVVTAVQAAAIKSVGGTVVTSGMGPTVAAFASFLTGAAIGATVGYFAGMYAAKLAGIQGRGAGAVAAGGAIAGAIAGGVQTYLLSTVGINAWFASFGQFLLSFGVVLFWAAVAIIIMIILVKCFGLFGGSGEIEKRIVEFRCMPWEAPVGGGNCDKCNGDELKPCSKYRCESLGQTCKFLNPGTEKEKCVNINPNDRTPPKISAYVGGFSSGYYPQETENGFKIMSNESECIMAFTPLSFGIKLDEPSQCRYSDTPRQLIENMSYFGNSNFYEENHTMPLVLPSLESLGVYGVVPNRTAELSLYIKCQDTNGNFNPYDYKIDFCIKPMKDITPPQITAIAPISPILAYNQTSMNMTLYLNEPSECKYHINDTEYNLMSESMNCQTDIFDVGLFGWECKTELKNLGLNNLRFYFRCKDQPWLAGTENESQRNSNTESYAYDIFTSQSSLKINSLTPSGTLQFGQEPMTIELKAETSGGANSGEAACKYSFIENATYIMFYDSFSSTHKQIFDRMLKGNYEIFVKCEDIAENTAEQKTEFKLEIDITPPEIIRIYSTGSLNVITDEDSECVYTNSNCLFPWSNSTKMAGIQKSHTTDLQQGKTYYIKCMDIWGNKPDSCSIILKTS